MTPRGYVLVFIILLVLLALTVTVAYLDWGVWSMILALLIASTKALLVILYFMHVRYSSRLIWIYAAVGFIWLGILIVLTLSDYLTRGWFRG
ncbi:MAG: cytochrome C oxidase subunit IV family protein [Caldilineaceae bacterium]